MPIARRGSSPHGLHIGCPLHSVNEPKIQNEMQHDEQFTKNGANPSVHGNGYHKDIPIPGEQGPALDVGRHPLGHPATGHRLPAQGLGRAHLAVHRGAYRHRPGQPHLRSRRLGPRPGGRGGTTGDRGRGPEDVGSENPSGPTSPPSGANVAGEHPRTDVGSATWPKRRPRGTTPPTRER